MANPDHLGILQDALAKKNIEIWNTWRKQNPDIYPDLIRVDLSNTNLSDANLRYTDLMNVNFEGADLIRTDFNDSNCQDTNFTRSNLVSNNFVDADLTNANFEETIVAGVDFGTANLSRTIFRQASLIETDFIDTNLQNSDFEEAECDGIIFADVDLSTAKNLDKAIIQGPCTIGIDTLEKSGGNIPTSFLRDCGIPDEIIKYCVDLRTTIQYHKLFISYSHENMIFANRLFDTLQDRGIRCWKDTEDVKGGITIRDEAYNSIRSVGKFLLLCSQESLNSIEVQEEIEQIFAREKEEFKKTGEYFERLIPVDIDGYLFDEKYQHRYKALLQKRRVMLFKGMKNDDAVFDREIENVIKALEIKK